MDIGKPERVIIVEPLEAPTEPDIEPIAVPVEEPAPEREKEPAK